MNPMVLKLRGAALIFALTSMASFAQGAPPVFFSLGDRVTCQAAIERVYWRHRTAGSGDAKSKLSFEESVPAHIIQPKAEDVVLKSAALERFWSVTITGAQLQAELDRMAANSRAPDVLRSGGFTAQAGDRFPRPAI